MSLIKTLSLAALAATTSSLGLVACGGDDDGGGPAADAGDPVGTHTQFVIDDLTVPANASQSNALALDLDDDGIGDNALGGLLGALGSVAGLDLQTGVDEQLVAAEFVLLASIQATDLVDANDVGTYVFFGENPSPAACTDPLDIATCGQHLNGSGSFDISANSPADAVLVGTIAGGELSAGPGTVSIELPLGEGEPLQIDLIGARIEATVSADGLMSGKLGGAITCTDVDQKLMPAVVTLIANVIDESCTGAGDDCGCIAGSSGEQILVIFDNGTTECAEFDQDGTTCIRLVGQGDCAVEIDELFANSLIDATLRNPDLDLIDNVGNCESPSVGEDESLSLGIGFSGVPATFALPAGL